MITIEQIKRLRRIARTRGSSRLELLCIEAVEAIGAHSSRAADVPCVKAIALEYPLQMTTKLGHTMMRCNASCECTTCGQSGSVVDTAQGIELRGVIFRERCSTAIAAEAALDQHHAAARFARLSDEARAYCAEHGADEHCSGLGVAVRDLVAKACRAWVASLPSTMITVWAVGQAADAPRFAEALMARGFVTTCRDWCGVTNASLDDIAAVRHELGIAAGGRIIKREVLL